MLKDEMTLRGKIAAFHARIHSHRHKSHHRDASSSNNTSTSTSTAPSAPSSSQSASPSRGGKRLSPVLTLMIPTGAGNVEARVYHPAEFPANYGRAQRKAAVVAHPYAGLGGNWDDPVVLAVVGVLLERGWVVATFNFGGAGNSKGKTSWTGAPEREEYATVAAFLIRYVECLDPNSTAYSPDGTAAAAPAGNNSNITPAERPPMKVLLAGYSYGSLIASRVPSADRVVRGCDSDVLAYATRTAYEWASTERRRSFAMHRGAGRTPWCQDTMEDECPDAEPPTPTDTATTTTADGEVDYSVQTRLQTSWLLVSPLLAPVSTLLNLPNPLSWFRRKEADEDGGIDNGDGKEVLAVFGTEDMFTGVGRYHSWASAHKKRSSSFMTIEAGGVGHFWAQEEKWMALLRQAVATWLDELQGLFG
ncbi:hypothetical protein Dda_8697 [Drechslerella dactyloides]|uniref:AB hydrolase-1 domain-containing protein n=1 Tax=Drechslerella dactyloides TaxID=74499 RepID=A0AAD6IQV5_DREDA|nr:hypothetical protein Dda_8697 [Drechslerella dactyloides]